MARLDYFAPGVYVEEVDRGSRPIEGVQTNIAGFVGFTEAIRGGAELGKPVLVASWNQYLEYFARENSDGFTDFDAYLPFAVNGWFLNGGARCWIVSIGTDLPKTDPENQQPDFNTTAVTIKTASRHEALQVRLKSDATCGSVRMAVLPGEPKALPEDPNTPAPIPAEFFTLVVKRDGEELEIFRHLTMDTQVQPEVGDYVVTKLQESQYLQVADVTQSGLALARRPVDGQYEISMPPLLPTPENLARYVQGIRDDRRGIQGLFEIDEITIIACPDLMRAYEADLMNADQVHNLMQLMVSLCENSAPNPPNRMVVLDTPPECIKPQQVVHWLDQDFSRRSMFAALYYPWIKVPNPRKGGRSIAIPPCGHMMGIWSRTDETRGVYKAPANETPRGVVGLAYDCNFREQEMLNPRGINCIRTFPNRGIKVWGARTLVEPEKTDWRYINVRRLVSYIEKSIELGTQWVVFEPNDQDLWARVRRTVNNFLERLWREGALFGATPEQAFYVKCDEEINTPETMLLGRLYVEVGICPVRPAEFVVFRISQWVSQQDE
ncbi:MULTISPECIES: phage tail sheath C-terminal domain-containing protein [unclassified Leptolyngbya]|uniref:phage tail sheath family protein n=1 Tax=unclassified Leptolyngbya TaxID=2650499 RepID=UPI001684EB7A|nr:MULTISPECIES: phage tail sheath C-terminal domain-containing protein [unclassified Leptolyngbya]MBD1909750.1 phage tail sheath family protein [Leptolyngbya sp. FACHB-8]MBD2157648.1 phage tail sheath family protein [Leptolyngbya sp. FACHB-16]